MSSLSGKIPDHQFYDSVDRQECWREVREMQARARLERNHDRAFYAALSAGGIGLVYGFIQGFCSQDALPALGLLLPPAVGGAAMVATNYYTSRLSRLKRMTTLTAIVGAGGVAALETIGFGLGMGARYVYDHTPAAFSSLEKIL